MRHFKPVRSDIDPNPVLDGIASVDGPGNGSTGRQADIAVQRGARAIPLRGLRQSALGDRKRRDAQESPWTSSSTAHPAARAFLEEIATAPERASLEDRRAAGGSAVASKG